MTAHVSGVCGCVLAVHKESLNLGSQTCVSMGFLVPPQASDIGL